MLFIFIMPFISLAAVADGWWPLAVLCCVVFFVGLLLERWLFFAEANTPCACITEKGGLSTLV